MSLSLSVECHRGNFDLGVGLSLDGAGIIGVFGESGSGKTSLMRALAGLDAHWHGTIRFNDICWQDTDKKIFVAPHKRRVGFVFQGAELFEHLTILDNLKFALKQRPAQAGELSLEDMIQFLDLDDFLGSFPEQVSGGERQRAAIAQALLAGPNVLVMDEPMASMSDARKAALLPYIKTIRQRFELPIFYITHSVFELKQLADEIVCLQGSAAELVTDVGTFGIQSAPI
ncbi:MAG: molybdate transport system ATP-binding protein [Alcanivorax sp.]|jgi:molybdate transport system ATP-binding protein